MSEKTETDGKMKSIRIEGVSEDEYEILWRLKGPNRTWKEFLLDVAADIFQNTDDEMLAELISERNQTKLGED